jgi:hypothetical protein
MFSVGFILSWFLSILDFALMLAAALLLLLRPRWSPLVIPQWFRRLARRPVAAFFAVGLAVLLLRVALIPVLGIPQPFAHDEYSYLLAADTFAHGRLTNPTPPLWQHFETFHIIMQPTYQSMYAPGQGLILALGELLGNPWIGELLITSLLFASLQWMLRAWLPPVWALMGACLAALRLGILSYWMNGYWSSSIVALAGVLVLGALPRLQRRPNVRDALLMGLGLVLLANTRPYEGLIYSLPFAAAMLLWLRDPRRPSWPVVISRVIIPLAAVLLIGALATGFYYRSVTGNPFRMTYQVDRSTYGMPPYFLWSSPRPEPVYRHPAMRALWVRESENYHDQQNWRGFFKYSALKFARAWAFFLGPLLSLPFLLGLWHWRDRRTRFAIVLVIAVVAALLPETWGLPHYFAPATGAFFLLVTQGLRYLAHWRWRNQIIGPALIRRIFAIAVVIIGSRLIAAGARLPIDYRWPRGNLERTDIMRQLATIPGGHIIIVQYTPSHTLDNEWVFNAANLESSRIIWARDMGPQNQELRQQFPDRRMWVLHADDTHPQPEPLR